MSEDATSQVQEFRSKIVEVLRRHDVKRASLFGSIVRNEMRQDSDIDLLVEFSGKKSLLDLVGLKLDLEETVKRRFDVVTYRSISPLLKDRILGEQVAIIE
ncbi:MAG TPA: nucleotidyltransferase family protein [Methanotrichaceae archaeon]|nr:nucleotidyltransferase family protein [Methanotrichaceae archaeon]HQF16013.1 nucleotidyltransferase family protein [Methanotrichaceae archaeon]HQI90639.1 nucleotidyltransferase family protein [Methanotrichaceae archaeon]HQJ28080.1 nucleotidyltransferase family protein [Methanotrichaceae archaeon]